MSKNNVTGIVQQAQRLEWTTLRFSKSGVGTKERSGQAQADNDEAFDPAAEIKKHASSFKGNLHVALPAERVLMHVTELPTTEMEEIEGMANLQLDEVSPFPLEQLYSSFEILDQDEQQSQVIILAAQQEDIDALEEMYHAVGLHIERIDVDVLGWWHLIKTHMPTRFEKRRFLIIFTHQNTFLITIENGIPRLFRSLGTPGEGECMEDFMTEVAEDIEYTQTSLDSGWEDTNVTLDLWHWGAVPSGINRLEEKTGMSVEVFTLSDLPPLSEGIAQRASSREGKTVDLVPQEWKESKAILRAKRKFLYSCAAMLVLWICSVAVFLTLLHLRQKKLNVLESEVVRLKKPAEEVELIIEKIKSLSQLNVQTHSALECLRETSIHLQKPTLFSSWKYRKSRMLEIQARGPNEQLHKYNQKLENAALFSEYKSNIIILPRNQGYALKATAKLPEVKL